jgi:hypothetical protein
MTEELKIYITAEIGKLKSELDKGKKEVEDFGKKGKVSFQEFNDEVQKVGDFAKKGLAVTGAAIAGAATALLALGNSTKEYRVAQAKLNTAFEAAGATAGVAKQTYNDLYRVLGDTDVAVEASNHLAKLTTNQSELSEWTKICQGVYATFGDSLPIEGLTEAANETARVGAVTGPLADALNWAGVSEDEFNAKLEKCTSTQEREKLIRETLNGLYTTAAEGYEENAKEILAANEAQEKLNEATAKLGEVMAPINTMLTEFGAEIMAEITPYITDFAEKYGPTIKETLTDIAKGIGDVLTWLIDNWELVSTIGTIILTIATALGVFSTAMGIVNFVMAASPVTWIVLGIVAALTLLVTGIVLVIKYWDEIKAATEKAINKMKEVVQKGIDKIVEIFNKVVNFVKENWQGLLLLIINPFAGAFKLAYDNCEGFRKNVDNFISKLKNGVKAGFEIVKNSIINPIKEAKEKVSGVINGIKSLFNFDFKLPKIKTPSFSIRPSGWSVGDLLKGTIPKLSVSWNAVGGVFDSPTIIPYGNTLQGLGEDGAEAIVPLEKNTQWLDKIADKLAARQVATPTILNVDGKVFAQTAINTINEHTRQTGSLKLNIM